MKYKLYIGAITELPKEIKFTYYSSTDGYMLAYHNGKVADMQEIPSKNEHKLSNSAREWLRICKLAVNCQAMAENTQKYTSLLSNFLNVLEDCLVEAKKEKEDGKQANN